MELDMSYSSLMVHLDLEPSNDARLRIAGDLATRFDAHVIGIAAGDLNPPAYGRSYGGGSFEAALITEERATIEKQLAEVERRFRATMGGYGHDMEWRQAFEKPNPFVARQARAADLIITGLGCYGNLLDPFRALDPSTLVIEAGRPILIVPPEVESFQGRRILLGWKDTREARRAIWDALPLLQAAEYVVVSEILESDDLAAAHSCVDDVAEWLDRHEVIAMARAVKANGETAELLQDLASEELADLLVTGAYGHSRLGEWIWGGVSQKLLASSQLCCFLAH